MLVGVLGSAVLIGHCTSARGSGHHLDQVGVAFTRQIAVYGCNHCVCGVRDELHDNHHVRQPVDPGGCLNRPTAEKPLVNAVLLLFRTKRPSVQVPVTRLLVRRIEVLSWRPRSMDHFGVAAGLSGTAAAHPDPYWPAQSALCTVAGAARISVVGQPTAASCKPWCA